MNFNYLEYFITLAKYEHYTKAADVLYISQSTLSYAIASLEKELGVLLFEKEGRNVVLTRAGEIFLQQISEGVASIRAGTEKIRYISQGRGLVRIGSLRVLTQDIVPKIAYDFKQAKKEDEVHYQFSTATGMSVDIIKGIKNKAFDVGFTSLVENEPNLAFHPIYEQKLILVVPEEHPLAKYDALELSRIKDEPFIMFDKQSGLYSVISKMLTEAELEPRVVYSASEDETVAGLVAAKFGLAIVPYMEILHHMPLKMITIKNSTVRRFFYLTYLKDSYKLPVVNHFIRYVLEHYSLEAKVDR